MGSWGWGVQCFLKGRMRNDIERVWAVASDWMNYSSGTNQRKQVRNDQQPDEIVSAVQRKD